MDKTVVPNVSLTKKGSTVSLYRTVQGELEMARETVARLESYLGGDLPQEGVTWREERAALLTRISVSLSLLLS